MSKKLINSVLDKIKEEKIKPIPRWEFILKNVSFWLLYLVALILGTLSASVIIFKLTIADWDFRHEIAGPTPNFLIRILPFFWLILFTLLLTASYYNLRHTKKGYKYKFSIIVLSNIGLSIIFGSLLFQTGVAERVEDVFLRHAPFYEQLEPNFKDMWSNPESGLLGGEILEIEDDDKIIILDFKNSNWVISLKELERPGNPEKLIEEGKLIKIFGEITPENCLDSKCFKAIRIKPWEGNIKMPMHMMAPPIPRP